MDVGVAAGLAGRVLENPFVPHDGRAAAEAAVAEIVTAPAAALEALAARARLKEARRLAVAVAFQECALRGDSLLFDARATPDPLFAQLGIARRTVRDIALAGARCTAAILRLAGSSAAMQRVRAATWRACFGESLYEAIRLRPLIREQNVLVLGEIGTGKELVAQAIALAEPEPARLWPFNAGVPAGGGTLFVDEVGELPAEQQTRLWRLLEERRGDLRAVAATAQPLAELVERGAFRRDLYQRLAGVTLGIPPLRERLEDLQPIADSLFARFAARLGGAPAGGGAASTAHLSRLTVAQARLRAWLESPEARAREWRGNVRELASVVRSWVLGFEDG